MKTCFKHILFILCIIAGFATLTTTCTFEDDDNNNGGGITHPLEEGMISFKLKLPNNSTRALTLADENELDDVKILVFKTTGEFLYSAEAILDILDNEPMVKRYKAKVSPTKNNEKVDIMTIANAGSIIRKLYPDGIPNNQGITRSDLTNVFTIECPNGWIVRKSDSNYTPIPMWGWAPGVSIDAKTGLDEAHSTFHLTRMVAKVDVSIIGDAQKSFKMTAVYLMNRNTVGRLIPNVASPNVWTGSSPKAVTPSLPNDPKPEKGADNYLEYGDNYVDVGTLEHEVKGVIYSFEAEKGVAYEPTKAYEESPCIIIGGKFLNSPNVTYYRVDFEKTTAGGQKEHLHLLRNYLYSISISRITGPGYPDIDGALKNKPLNIIGEVEPWIDSDMPHQVTDGIHVLSVDRDEFLFYAPGDADSMRIYTDVSNGWRINTANVPSWLHFVSPSPNDSGYVKGAPLSYIRLIIKPDEIKETDSPRETSFTVEAGALKKSITVRQTNESPHGLKASPSVLIFPLSAPKSKTIKVTSTPSDAVRSVIYTTTGSIKFLPGKGPQDYHNTKATEFVIQPVAGGSGTVHMIIRTANTEGLSDTEVVTIIQLNTDSMFGMVGLPDAGYEAADYGDKIIQILSEIPWKLNILPQNNPSNAPWTGNMLKLTDLDEHPPRPEILVDYHFELFRNPNYGGRAAYVGVQSTVPGWQYITFPIKQKGTPPYVRILSPESKKIDFGESTEPLSIEITTNAGWKFSGDNDYSKVIQTTDVAGDIVHSGSNIALEPVVRTITFTPTQPSNEMLKAGTEVSTIVKFQTASHPDSLPVGSDEIVITRKAKVFCQSIYYRYEESHNLLYVTTLTNTDWRVRCDELNIDSLISVDSYAAHTASFPIPGDEIFSERYYKFITSSGDHEKDTTIRKVASTLQFVDVEGFPTTSSNEKIPAQGMSMANSTYYLIFEGSYKGDFDLQAIRKVTGMEATFGPILRGNTHKRKMSITSTDTWSERTITFRYRLGTSSDSDDPNLLWRYIRYPMTNIDVSFKQAGYEIAGRTNRQYLDADPAWITLYLKGFFPEMQLYAKYGNTTTENVIVGNTPTDLPPNEERSKVISIPAAESWSEHRDVQFYAKDPTGNIEPILLTSLPQNVLKIDPPSINLGALDDEGPVSHNFTGYHSALKVEVEERYTAAITPTPAIYPAGSGLNLQLIVKKNEGNARTMLVYIKDVETSTERCRITIQQPGAGAYLVQGPYQCSNWPTVADYTPIDFDEEKTMSVATVIDHFENAGILIEAGKVYSIASTQPKTGEDNHYWTFSRDAASLGSVHNNQCREYYVLLKKSQK